MKTFMVNFYRVVFFSGAIIFCTTVFTLAKHAIS